jgi:hypothetical protein
VTTDAFGAARQAWLETPMPAGSTTDDVDELKADLAYWDHMVAETVLPYVNDGVWREPPVDVHTGLAAVRQRVTNCARSATVANVELLRQYDAYAGLLATVYAEAERHAAQHARP